MVERAVEGMVGRKCRWDGELTVGVAVTVAVTFVFALSPKHAHPLESCCAAKTLNAGRLIGFGLAGGGPVL